MSSGYQRILVNLHVLALLFCVIFQFQPRENESLTEYLINQCQFDTQQLCPECFTPSIDCGHWANLVTIDSSNPWNTLSCRYNPHGVSYGLLNNGQKAVIKKLNKNQAVEALLNEICQELQLSHGNCMFKTNSKFIKVLKTKVLEQELEGCIICPPKDENALNRLLNEFKGAELLKLILMKINVQPLLLQLFAGRGFPVPKVIFQGGFQLVESFDGDTLVNFYDSSLNTRLGIAKELIRASFRFTEGVNGFRFYLTDINPDNIAVKTLPNGTLQVSFIDLDNVIILDSQSKLLDHRPDKARNIHSRIDCDGCFAYVQEDLCSYQHSDINQYAICQLLYENLNGNREGGFLHVSEGESRKEIVEIRQLLHHCVYCVPPDCRDREGLLQQVQEIMNRFLIES